LLALLGAHHILHVSRIRVNILGKSIHTLKENAEALVTATRQFGLEVSADKTKYIVMSRDQNSGRIHSLRTDNSTFERVDEFKYLGTILTNQNSIAQEINSRLREGRRPLGRPRRRWVDNIRTDLQEVGCGYMDGNGLAQDRDSWRTLVSAVMNLRVLWNAGNFLTSFSRRTLHHGVSK